jgi:hypothetical protein
VIRSLELGTAVARYQLFLSIMSSTGASTAMRMTRQVVWLAAAVVSGVVCLSAQGRPDFSGTWVVVSGAAVGQGKSALGDECRIKQDRKALSLECGTVPPSAPAGWFFPTARWGVPFDGTEAHPWHKDGNTPVTKYVSRDGTPLTKLPDTVATASWDGNQLTVMERSYILTTKVSVDTGTVTNVTVKYVFSLDADDHLTIESTETAEGRDPYPARQRVYKRKTTSPAPAR